MAPVPSCKFIDIPLTGERTYLHGADIFDALTSATGAARDIVLSLKTAGACALELRDEPAAPACGRFRYACAGAIRRQVLRHRPDRPISVRLPMSEDALVADATFMRRTTALAVALLQLDFPDDHWSIAEIACRQLPSRDARAEVAVRSAVGNRFWKIAAFADGAAVGHVIMARGLPRR